MKKIFLAIFIVGLALFANRVGLQQKANPESVSAAAVDYFLKIDGIPGESTDDAHRNEIEILSWSWGETSEAALLLPAVQSAREAANRSVPEISDFMFEANMSKASPKLMQAALSGQHIPQATLFGLRNTADGQKHEFMIIKFSDLLVSSYQTGGSSGAIPVDSFSLNFGKIEFEYKAQNEDGSAGESVKAGWDVKANKAI